MSNVKKSILWRIAFCFVGVAVFAVYVIYHIFSIQVVEGEQWLSRSDSTMIIRQGVNPTRGNIYSEDGALLATSMPSYEVRFDPTVVDRDSFRMQVGDLAVELSRMFPNYSASYYKTFLKQGRRSGSRYMLIHRRVNYNQYQEMRTWPIFRMGRYKGGMIAILTTRRVRPAGQLALRTIGYRTKDNPGVGLERAYDIQLAGDTGSRLVQKISGGYRPLSIDNLLEPQNGKDVYTTLDVNFQEVVHAALGKALVKHKADHGCVVVMEMKTGKIKAIVNLKRNDEDRLVESYNYAIGESVEPGSIFKVFSAVAALEDGYCGPEDSLKLYGGERIYFKKKMKDSDHARFDKVSFQTAFARSSNVAFSSVIYDNYKKDPGAYIAHLKRLDLHKKTGIEIMGEPAPFLNQPTSKSWSKLTLPWLAIGYENQHTPLQMLTSYNAVINGGKLVKPYLVSKVADAGLVIEEYIAPEPVEVCSKETSDILRAFTAETVLTGTGKNIRSKVVSMGGKTGTAQIASTAGYQSFRQYNASFIGHFPTEDPVYTAIVMINRPSNGVFYASWVAAPVFKELAERIYTISVMGEVNADTMVHPNMLSGFSTDHGYIQGQLGWPMSDVTAPVIDFSGDSSRGVAVSIATGEMPNVVGMGLRDAIYILEREGVKVKANGYGRIKAQSPKAGVTIEKERTVYLSLGI